MKTMKKSAPVGIPSFDGSRIWSRIARIPLVSLFFRKREDEIPEEAFVRLLEGIKNPKPATQSQIDSLRRVLKSTSL